MPQAEVKAKMPDARTSPMMPQPERSPTVAPDTGRSIAESAHELRPAQTPCPLYLRLLAMLYDGLLLVAVWMVGTLVWLAITGRAPGPGETGYRVWLAILAFGYFHLGWRGGQTLGMRTWSIHLVRDEHSAPMWRVSLLRLATAILSASVLGLGFLSSLWRSDRRTWHDRLSRTRLVRTRRGSPRPRGQEQR